MQAWRLIFFTGISKMEKHIATYTIDTQNLQQTISLLYEVFLRTGQSPTIVITGKDIYRWDEIIALKLVTKKINESEFATACKI